MVRGITVRARTITVRLSAIVSDAPAKAYVPSVKSHTGYNSCTKYSTEDCYKNGWASSLTYSELRSDSTFRNAVGDEYHRGTTILEQLPIDIVQQIPVDYMHLVCPGVRNLLALWFKGSKRYRLGTTMRDEISVANLQLEPRILSDFSRKPHTFSDLERGKAMECRLFLLYTGPVVTCSKVPHQVYENFWALHVAINILASHKLYCRYTDRAEKHIRHFAENLMRLHTECIRTSPFDGCRS